MNVTFFFGSGISLASGVRGVKGTTDFLLNETFYQRTDKGFGHGVDPSSVIHRISKADPIQAYLKKLKDENDEYFKGRFPNEQVTNYEDLFSLLDQIENELLPLTDNLALSDFIKRQEQVSLPHRKQFKSVPDAWDLKLFCKYAKRLIEDSIRYSLQIDNLEGLELLRQLFEETSTDINIYTLNHDLLVEALCNSMKATFSDGFTPWDEDVRYYDPSTWDNYCKIKVYKLHGAIDWYWIKYVRPGDTPKGSYGILRKDIWQLNTASGTRVEMKGDEGNFLTGVNKGNKYYDGIFGEMHYRFSNHLRSCNRIVVSGYGWNDYLINRKLFDWLNTNPDARMLIIHGKPTQMMSDSRHINEIIMRDYLKNGRIQFCEKWFEAATMSDIKDYLE